MKRFGGIGHTTGVDTKNTIYLHKDEIKSLVSIPDQNKIPVYYDHDYSKPPIGSVDKLMVDKKGNLLVAFNITESGGEGKRIISDIENGKSKFLSLGMITKVHKGTGEVVSRELKELSIVPKPGLPGTFITHFEDDYNNKFLLDLLDAHQQLFNYYAYKGSQKGIL
jgi:phage head maturation protease